MENFDLDRKEAIMIGDLAHLYNISKRALRLYHERGLLIPSYIDEQTGYRYYSPAQLPRLEMILQMKNAGLSLKQIGQMLVTRDLSLFEAILGEQIDILDEKIAAYEAHRSTLIRQLESCKYIRNPPPLDTIFMEYTQKRFAFVYRDIDSYDLGDEYPEGSPWHDVLTRVRNVFLENNVPMGLFQQVGGIVDKRDLLKGRFLCTGAYIQLKEERQYGLPTTTIPSGTYVCMYNKYTAMDNAEECRGIQMLMNYITEKELQIQGPYIAQVVAETAIFDSNSSSILVKQQIPVKIPNDKS